MATIWINPTTGNDSNPGTQASPKLTFDACALGGADGDTIMVAGGAHVLSANFTGNFQTYAKNMTVDTETGDPNTTYFDGQDLYYYLLVLFSDSSLTIKNLGYKNCKFNNYAYTSFGGNAAVYTFDNLLFKNMELTWGNGLIYSNRPIVSMIVKNTIVDNPKANSSSYFVRMDNGTDSNILLQNNSFYFEDGAINISQSFGQNSNRNYITLENNIIRNTSKGLTKAVDCASIVTANAVHYKMRNNCLFASGVGASIGNFSISPLSTDILGNITTDPLFVDAVNSDFRLQASSPCVNGGIII